MRGADLWAESALETEFVVPPKCVGGEPGGLLMPYGTPPAFITPGFVGAAEPRAASSIQQIIVATAVVPIDFLKRFCRFGSPAFGPAGYDCGSALRALGEAMGDKPGHRAAVLEAER